MPFLYFQVSSIGRCGHVIKFWPIVSVCECVCVCCEGFDGDFPQKEGKRPFSSPYLPSWSMVVMAGAPVAILNHEVILRMVEQKYSPCMVCLLPDSSYVEKIHLSYRGHCYLGIFFCKQPIGISTSWCGRIALVPFPAALHFYYLTLHFFFLFRQETLVSNWNKEGKKIIAKSV